MPVITIGRAYGAGGETVGRLVAEGLGLELIDSKIWQEVARRLDLPAEEVQEREEEPASLLDRVLSALGAASADYATVPEAAWSPPYGELGSDTRQAVLRASQEVIREAARAGDVVIVGRGGGFVLRDHPGALHCFLNAPTAARAHWTMEHLGLDEEAAKRRVKEADANRAAYIHQVYNHDWLRVTHYDLAIDTGRLGYEGAATVIMAAARAS
ncbi:MAG TPA: cytidylate kinase-like family protein [Candidatus Acidoferrales bacterium]|nr:cytidylate kinase-like family protein [Candidatus Acidoferrales bacterium]